MARYETDITIPCPLDRAFAFVSDFRNASRWDPRTYAAELDTDGPIGLGTRFVLTGGVLHEDRVQRLRLPPRVAGMPLSYEVVSFDPPDAFVLAGASRILSWRDELRFAADGDGTRLHYLAELSFKGPLRAGEPLLRGLFQRIGDDATRDLPAVVAEGC
jgi:hypothetical protein